MTHAGKIEYENIGSGRNSSLIIALFSVKEKAMSSVDSCRNMGQSFGKSF